MYYIKYNNLDLDETENIVTFTEVPNILKVSEDADGTNAEIMISVESPFQSSVTGDGQFYITILGETITNVMNASKANNKRFFVAADVYSTAMSICRALRNCGSLTADYNIVHYGSDVYLKAKTIGNKWNGTASSNFSSNIPNSSLTISIENGTASSLCWNGKISVDVYSGSTSDLSNYVTTLEKNFYGNECAFDVSPVLATISEYGKTQPYYFNLNLIDANGYWSDMETVSGNSVIGYHANQSDDYTYANSTKMLININRGDNGTILYTYDNLIPFSILYTDGSSYSTIRQNVYDSSMNLIYTGESFNYRTVSLISDFGIVIPESAFTNAYYIDVQINNKTPIRFNVIKPLKAAENFQRIQWRNEYGGISFFDFTGARSETDSVDIETYEKNVFDFYNSSSFEQKKIYKNGYGKSVKLTSHLMEADGRWVFNSLMRSKKVWTTVNGKTYYIIPKSIEITEDSNYNNVYTATLTYEYSYI